MAYRPVNNLDLQISTFRGVAEDIDIPVQAKHPADVIKAGDEILCCLELDTESSIATCKDKTANISVSRNGYITNDTAPTSTAWTGLLFWRRLNGGAAGYTFNPVALKCVLVTGGAADTDLTATGIELEDTILAAFHLTTAAAIATLDDITSHVSIGSVDAKIQCDFVTTSDQIWVFYHDHNGTPYFNPSLQFALLDGAADATDITVTGATAADKVVFVGHISTKASVATLADLTSEGSFTDDNDFQMSTTDTTNDLLFLIWLDVA